MRVKNSPILLYLRTCPPALVQLSRAEMEVVFFTFLLRPPPLTSGLEGRVPREVKVREVAGIKVRKFVVVLFDKRLSSKHRGEREEAPCLSPLTTPAGVAYFAHVRRSREVSVSLFPPPPPRLFLGNGFPPPFSCKSSASPPLLFHSPPFDVFWYSYSSPSRRLQLWHRRGDRGHNFCHFSSCAFPFWRLLQNWCI